MHIGSAIVGAELFADTLYVGKLKGVGTVWQYSVVDGACSIGFGGVRSGRKTARRMAAILESQVLPRYREAGIRIRYRPPASGPDRSLAHSFDLSGVLIEAVWELVAASNSA